MFHYSKCSDVTCFNKEQLLPNNFSCFCTLGTHLEHMFSLTLKFVERTIPARRTEPLERGLTCEASATLLN
jgi:hypothetical protein